MGYVYMQQAMPSDTTGVPVTLSVVDANGNYRVIGQTTTDSSGMFTYAWAPDIPGTYAVMATFEGSNGYLDLLLKPLSMLPQHREQLQHLQLLRHLSLTCTLFLQSLVYSL